MVMFSAQSLKPGKDSEWSLLSQGRCEAPLTRSAQWLRREPGPQDRSGDGHQALCTMPLRRGWAQPSSGQEVLLPSFPSCPELLVPNVTARTLGRG